MNPYFKHNLNGKTIFQIPALESNYIYMISKGKKAWVFDPGEFAPVQSILKKYSLTLEAIYITHHHYDHVDGIEELCKEWQCPVFGHELDSHRIPCISNLLKNGDKVNLGDLGAEVIFLPGHTTGLIAYYFKKENWLFSNDLIFSLGCGKLFEGTAQQMQKSLSYLFTLPPQTLLMISHEYSSINLDFCLSIFPEDEALLEVSKDIQVKHQANKPTVPTTIEYQKKYNPFIRWDNSYIRKKLNMESAKDWQIFAEIRRQKDTFPT